MKKVLLVGNSSRLTNRSIADRIDSYDVVCRFNFGGSKVSFDIRGNTGIVTSSAPYSKHLEYGTQNMKARPFMFTSLEKNRRRILKMFKEARLLRRTS